MVKGYFVKGAPNIVINICIPNIASLMIKKISMKVAAELSEVYLTDDSAMF